ncbi:unnamed protein product [Effrenium voratum]|uniref:EamA domain-containing protein n=1 Tax=Effrenium voratum TaxID=2562239 RepID=A0AA36JBP9_9DINO|nr:unnamed protein product [Effrenium voratum]
MAALSQSWLGNSLVCVVLYGLWGFLGKLALVKGLSSSQQATLEKLGFFLCMPLVMRGSRSAAEVEGPAPSFSTFSVTALRSGGLWAMLSGACAALASKYYSQAMAQGQAGPVSALTASYPPITMLLAAAFTKERITGQKLLGSLFTLLGTFFFAR